DGFIFGACAKKSSKLVFFANSASSEAWLWPVSQRKISSTSARCGPSSPPWQYRRDRRSRRAWHRRGASWRRPWLLLASWRLVLWRPRDDGHDVDAVAGEDGDVRVILEEAGGGGDVGGFDDQKAGDLVLRIGDAGFGDAPGLAHHDVGRDDGSGVALAPL